MKYVYYKFTDTEIKKLMAENLVIITDSREQANSHVLDYFDKVKVNHIEKKLDAGDYAVMISASPELGIMRDLHLPICIEKKNSIDELASSFKDRTRFENEFIRAAGSKTKIMLLVEDINGYENILTNNYKSEYGAKALLSSLKSFEARYNFSTTFIDKKCTGNFINYTLRYYVYEFLKN